MQTVPFHAGSRSVGQTYLAFIDLSLSISCSTLNSIVTSTTRLIPLDPSYFTFPFPSKHHLKMPQSMAKRGETALPKNRGTGFEGLWAQELWLGISVLERIAH